MNDFVSLPQFADAQAYALAVALSGAGICAAVLMAARPFQRRSEVLTYGILLGGVIGLVAIPMLVGASRSLPVELLWPAAPAAPEIVKVPAERLDELLAPAALDNPVVEDGTAWSSSALIGGILMAVWLLGLAVGLGRLAYALVKQRGALIQRPWQASFWTEELGRRLARQLGLKRFPDVYGSPAAPMPMVVGLVRPRIILPEPAPLSWSQPQFEAVLLHEAAHIARRDPWAVLAQRLAVILFWWCPLVYVLSRRLNELRESICDDYALQGSCDHVAYAEILVESAERLLSLKTVPAPVALLDSARGGLEARVTRLLEKERRPMLNLSLPGKILGAGFLAAACLLTSAATALSGAQAQPEKKIQIKIVVDGKEIDVGDLIEAAPKKAVTAAVTLTAPDKHVTTASGDMAIRLWDPATGKAHVVGAGDGVRFVLQGDDPASKPDPRIEDLVKQAEAIKPGSGAQIRAALQGTPKATARVVLRDVVVNPDKKPVATYSLVKPGEKAAHALNVLSLDATKGKKIIILSIEDGNVIQLKEQDVRKLLEKGVRVETRETTKVPVTTPTKKPRVEAELHLVPPTTSETKAAPTRSNEMDSLRRQLERISAELKALQQRLDEPRKK